MMAFSTICQIIATAFWVVAAALVLSKEVSFLGLDALQWAIFGLPFHGLGHWLPGNTGG